MRGLVFAVAMLLASRAHAQSMSMQAHTPLEAQQQHTTSGTAAEPPSTPVPMLMADRRGWRLMLHGNAFLANTQQQAGSHRGRDAFFSTNWIMPMAQHTLGSGTITLRTMLSLEPATVPHREYPELFQQGETAYGAPIVDGQHPHDFVMELAAIYDQPLGRRALLELYAAPVGDPALGPEAYPHRASASEDPIAALGHHQQDSTHIAFSVLTAGLTLGPARLELSGFHGGEPAEDRWHIAPSSNGHELDSVSTRLTLTPTPDLSAQYSLAHIHAPEALYPGEDQQRQTASVMLHHAWKPKIQTMRTAHIVTNDRSNMDRRGGTKNDDMAGMDTGGMDMGGMDMSGMQTEGNAPPPAQKPLNNMPGMTMNPSDQSSPSDHPPLGAAQQHRLPPMAMTPEPATDLAVTLLWGRTRAEPATPTPGSQVANSYLAEARLKFLTRSYLWTRLEDAARTNELALSPGAPLPHNFDEQPLGHVAAYSLGYDRDIPAGPHLLLAPGAQFTVYRTPTTLAPIYGTTPTAEVFFLRLRVR